MGHVSHDHVFPRKVLQFWNGKMAVSEMVITHESLKTRLLDFKFDPIKTDS